MGGKEKHTGDCNSVNTVVNVLVMIFFFCPTIVALFSFWKGKEQL
jgi:antibiotic biosynthesis monooxygenase (ABM) superfamily enzyme